MITLFTKEDVQMMNLVSFDREIQLAAEIQRIKREGGEQKIKITFDKKRIMYIKPADIVDMTVEKRVYNKYDGIAIDSLTK